MANLHTLSHSTLVITWKRSFDFPFSVGERTEAQGRWASRLIKCQLNGWNIVKLDLVYSKVKWSETAQLCLTLWDPVAYSLPPNSSVHGILQVRVLEWVAISFSRGSSQPRDWTEVSCLAGRRLTLWATREAQYILSHV